MNHQQQINTKNCEFNIILTQNQIILKPGQEENLIKKQLQNEIQFVNLKKGSSFWNLDKDYQTIYNNFSLLSYFSPICEIRILDKFNTRIRDKNDQYYNVIIDVFNVSNKFQFVLVEKHKDKFSFQNGSFNKSSVQQNKNSNVLKIVYEIFPFQVFNMQQKTISYQKGLGQIIVQFTCDSLTVKQEAVDDFSRRCQTGRNAKVIHVRNKQIVTEQFRQYIFIKIKDVGGWIRNNFSNIKNKNLLRISEQRKSTINQIEYFYIEPESHRFKIFQDKHVSLAFQGGGCKGIQYVGAQRAILTELSDLKITSVIGSSIGSLIGVSVCCGLTPQQIIQYIIIDKLSNAGADKRFPKQTKQHRETMRLAFLQVAKWLQQYKILQDQLTKKFRLYLQNPEEDRELQNILVELIKGNIDPIIRQLFIDTQQSYSQENQILQKNQSSKDLIVQNGIKVKKVQRLNLFGLFNGALMTGNVNKISTCICLAICISNLWKKKNSKKLTLQQEKQFQIMQKYKQISFIDDPTKISPEILQRLSHLNFMELYYLTGVQFTCTAVDLDNHVLRFFNQKTTPDLPVCKAVQMSASFPVAFQSQTWKKQWGKYYVHYQKMRREIDLTGVRFTDGGALSNLPIKYLDNEYMRPMYFSHVKTFKTKMYGVGFISDYQEPIIEAKQDPQKLKQKIKQMVVGRLGKWIPIQSLLKSKRCGNTASYQKQLPQHPFQAFLKIPVINFFLQLLRTWVKSKNNLNQQCFSHSTYETIIEKNYQEQLIHRYGPEHKQQRLKQVQKLMNAIYDRNKINDQRLSQIYISNLQYLQRKDFQLNLVQQAYRKKGKNNFCMTSLQLNQQQVFQQCSYLKQNLTTLMQNLISFCQNQFQIQQIMRIFRQSIMQQTNIKLPQANYYQAILNILQNNKYQKIFHLSEIQKDLQLTTAISKGAQKFCLRLKQNRNTSTILLKVLKNIHKVEQNQIKNSLQTLREQKINIREIHNLLKLQKITLTTPISLLSTALNTIRESKIPELFINLKAQQDSALLRTYVLRMINQYFRYQEKAKYIEKAQQKKIFNQQDIPIIIDEKNEQPEVKRRKSSTKINTPKKVQKQAQKQQQHQSNKTGVHIVLQAIPMCQMYFHTYYKIINDTLTQFNRKMKQNKYEGTQQVLKKKLKVTTMTSTGYHSLAMFLHSSDLPKYRIEEQIWKLRDLIKLDTQKIIQEYNKGQWSNIDVVLLRQVQIKAIQNRKDIFKYLEQEVVKNYQNQNPNEKFQDIKIKIKKQVDKIRFSNQEMNDAINNSLNYVVNQLLKIDKKKVNKKQGIENLIQKLCLNNPPYHTIQQIKGGSQGIQRLSNYFGQRFGDILKYLLYSSSFLSQQFTNLLRPQQRKEAWRVSLMTGIISGAKIKQYVMKILKQIKLKEDTTLKQFYQLSEKKIQLNFCVIQEFYFSIFNHYTRPNMPIWAAILAASSIPQFFSPVIDRPEWSHKDKSNFKTRQLQSHFMGKSRPYKLINSSQILSSFPLDLLKNNAFNKKITKIKNEIFLSFNFSDYPIPQIHDIKKFEMMPITIGELINKFIKITPNITKKTSIQQQNLKGLSLVGRLSAIKEKSHVMTIYVQSHDSLILRLYKKQIILNPVRFETLQFSRVYEIVQDPQNPNNKKCFASDLCEDTIMQTFFILSQKIRNRKAIEDIQYGDSLTEGRRILFVRMQTILDPKNKNLIKDKLKLRFLSMLNPQRGIQERFAIYYQQQAQNNKVQTSFTRLYKQTLQVINPKLQLKIQYVESEENIIKTSHFLIDLSELFKLGQNSRFGFVYALAFDKIYGFQGRKQFLTPEDFWKDDYMNRKSNIKQPTKIPISSLIQDSLYSTILCQKCLYILKIQQNKQQNYIFKCNCSPNNQQFQLSKKYDLRYDYKQKKVRCPLNHILNIKKSNKKHTQLGAQLNTNQNNNIEGGLRKFFLCNFCQRMHNVIWRDQECEIDICESCRIAHMDVIEN